MKDGLNITSIGNKHYYLNNKYHRKYGPAIENVNGHKEWWLYGQRHREDGPAIEYADGYKDWYYWGKHIDYRTQEEFERIIRLKAFW